MRSGSIVQKTTWIPAARFLSVMDRYKSDYNPEIGPNHVRTMRRIRSGEQGFISLDTADEILCRLGMTDWFHLPSSMGGLADIYLDGAQYGSPEMGGNHGNAYMKYVAATG